MSKDFSKTLNKHLVAAYEQGLREGVHRATMAERQAQAEKRLRFKIKRLLRFKSVTPQ